MVFELKQHLKLTQQLVMTPQLQQAIKLLQLSRVELADMISQEMEENPLLEEATDGEEGMEYPADVLAPEAAADEEGRAVERTPEITGEGDGREEFDWGAYYEDYAPAASGRGERKESDASSWDNLLTARPTLTNHLMWQLKLSPMDAEEVRIGEQIIGNLDPNGYLQATLEEIAEQEKVSPDRVAAILAKVQGFDPSGVAARDLRDCLLIQARLSGRDPLLETVIRDHLPDLEQKKYPQMAKKLQAPLEEILRVVSVIERMDPKPGRAYDDARVQPIVPDVFVVKAGEGYKILLNDEGMPRLRICQFYRDISPKGRGGSGSEASRYIKDRLQSATWLMKSIQQRQKTILRVAESIVRFQKAFFDRGIHHLRPLVLRDIAEDVEMHESTISRVVNNKYMHSPRGIFELKYFLSSSIQKAGGDAVASTSVKERIRKIVDGEDPKRPLSDQDIVGILAGAGITIARRTVAKYREMMGIQPSSRRRRFY